MKIHKKFAPFVAVFVATLTGMVVFGSVDAFAATKTWDSEGSDSNMATAANWNGDSVPTNGDDLVFPANQSKLSLVNNLTAGLVVNSITFSGAATQNSNYVFTGTNGMVLTTSSTGIVNSMTTANGSNISQSIGFPLTLGANATITATSTGNVTFGGALALSTFNLSVAANSGNVTLNGAITGSGTLTKTGFNGLTLGGDNSAYTGAITISAGALTVGNVKGIATSGGTTVANGADVSFTVTGEQTIPGNLALVGKSSSGLDDITLYYVTPKLNVYDTAYVDPSNGQTIGTAAGSASTTFSGNIVLSSSDTVLATNGKELKLTGALSGPHSFKFTQGRGAKYIINGSTNTTTTPNGTYYADTRTETLTGAQTGTDLNIVGSTKIRFDNSQYRNVTVDGPLATLEGVGSMGSLTVLSGGTVAPGYSPGCLTVTNGLLLHGTYKVDLGGTTGCDNYDQIRVTGEVDIDGAVLNASLFGDYKPKTGNTFVIIENDAEDAVKGTFTGLAEGATFKIGNTVVKVTYKGGSGNDVVLSVVTATKVPDTGFKLVTSNPFMSLLATLMTTGALVVGFRKLSVARAKN